MINYCGNCEYYDLNQKEYWGNRYYCVKTCKYKENNEEACSKYIDRQKKPDCFITTVVCNKLGYRDNCEYLMNLRNFRESYLKMSPEGRKLLQEYDQIGPIISNELSVCNEVDSILLMDKFIIPCSEAIRLGKYDAAITIYYNMVCGLKERFSHALEGITVDYNLQTPLEDLGKARLRKKTARA